MKPGHTLGSSAAPGSLVGTSVRADEAAGAEASHGGFGGLLATPGGWEAGGRGAGKGREEGGGGPILSVQLQAPSCLPGRQVF